VIVKGQSSTFSPIHFDVQQSVHQKVHSRLEARLQERAMDSLLLMVENLWTWIEDDGRTIGGLG